MLTIVGAIFVTVMVLLGYVLHGGKVGILIQPTEVIIIVGAAVGTVIMGNPMSTIKAMIAQCVLAMKGKERTKEEYLELLLLLFEVFKTAKGNLLGLEAHVEKPENSDIFKRYPSVLANHHAIHFLCDTLKVQISSPVSPFDLEELMDKDLKAMHEEEHRPVAIINRVGDAMPGLGIVAAVLGVVITMGKLTEGREVIGQSVAAALVGTFMGILLAYGYFQPLTEKIDSLHAQEGVYMDAIKQGILAFSKDASPKVCVEFSRRTIPPHFRPSFEEVDKATANIKK